MLLNIFKILFIGLLILGDVVMVICIALAMRYFTIIAFPMAYLTIKWWHEEGGFTITHPERMAAFWRNLG